MSTKKTLLTVGLTALGLSAGFAAIRAADPVPPPAPPGPSPTASAPAAPAPAVVLLSDGRVLQGFISEDAKGYLLRVKGGRLPFRKNQVEKIFHSIAEVYQYKRDRLPDRDPDERMKLAQWCLTNHMNAEAKEQLQAVLALSPKSVQAQRMMKFLDDDDDRTLFRDPAVVQAGAEVVEAPSDPSLSRAAAREFPGVGLPTIFDLPTPMAVRRAQEFNRNIHPILQVHCARCHNERFRGNFQLIQVRSQHDQTPTVLRANLEATLRLIDPESPDRSELLSSALVPHGGAGKGPIFRSPKDPSYQRISEWARSLRATRPGDDAAPARFATSATAAGEGESFAGARSGPQAGRVSLPFTPTPAPPTLGTRPVPASPSGPEETIPQPPGQILPGSGAGMNPYVPPDTEFPAPFSVGGPKPKLESVPGPAPAGPPPATQAVPGNAAPKAPAKPLKIDMDLLQKALMNRYTPQ